MKVVLACGDPAAVNAAQKLLGELMLRKHEGTLLMRASERDVGQEVQSAHVLWSGFATDPDIGGRIERMAISAAHRYNVPIMRYADTHLVYHRPHEDDSMRDIDALAVIGPSDKKGAARLYKESVRIFVSGNPMHEMYYFPEKDRETVRAELGVGAQTLIVSPGTKFPQQNIALWGGLGSALIGLPDRKFYFVLSRHPGDDGDETYDRLIEQLNSIPHITARLITRNELSGPQLLIGADLVVSFLSELGIGAAIRRIPNIEFWPSVLQERKQVLIGDKAWEPIEQGLAALVASDDPQYLRIEILRYLKETNERLMMLTRQRLIYGDAQPRPGYAVATMADVMEQIAHQ
ncbi:hypothetical protein C4568_02450 [Candidatus Parcubacteria bacterium]|nr:MAG: hypothetical protein C4568_02450 [Candidatus Parcubacteria bacterium]